MIFTASYRKLSLPDERVIYHTDNGMWRLQPTATKEQYHLIHLTCAFTTIIFLVPLIAVKTAEL